MLYTRREVTKLALAALPAAALLPKMTSLVGARQLPKPNSKWAGVQVGMNVPYNFGGRTMSGEETLSRCVQLGVSAVELRSQPVEAFLGAPEVPAAPGRRGSTPDQDAARTAAIAALEKWRLNAPLQKASEFRKQYEDAGVLIEIAKFDGIYGLSDGAIDYCFQLARTLGARAISCEIGSVEQTKRLGQFADKHQMMVGYHGHAMTAPANWEAAFAQAKYNGANVDIGHFIAGNNTSPVPFLTQHHARVTHIHVKDRKLNGGANTPFGQGDTPIKEVLQLIRDNKWTMQATIEFEYPVPEGSDRMAEMAKCLEFCRKALV